MELFPNLENDIENALTYFSSKYVTDEHLVVLTTGHEKCSKDKAKCGPKKYGYFIIHYVHKGRGFIEYYNKNNELIKEEIKNNELFLLYSDTTYTYYQDPFDPWEYSWISFYENNTNYYVSKMTNKYNPKIPIKNYEPVENSFIKIQNLNNYIYSKTTRVQSVALEIFSEILENMVNPPDPEEKKNYMQECLLYIDKNYTRSSLSVSEIAEYLNLNDKYLSRLFTSFMKMPLIKYINLLRLKKACILLSTTKMPIKDIAQLVGYNDPLYFSKKFSHFILKSPNDFRKDEIKAKKNKNV